VEDRVAHGRQYLSSTFERAADLLRRIGEVSKPYRKSGWRRALNALVRPLARLGLTGPRTHLLMVPGRRSGKLWSTPVSVVRLGPERWLVAPFGDRNWVRNARAAGRVELRRGRRRERLEVDELAPLEAVPVLREYYRLSRVTRPFFDATLASPDEDWLAEAPRHPVFRLRVPRASSSDPADSEALGETPRAVRSTRT
jgi:deazaflavin-dependent oxidoreductase (nitroreductase family)